MLQVPVCLLIFNRPELTRKTLEVVRQTKPTTLMVVADGHRPNRAGETEKCEETRQVLNEIDWDCKIIKNYSDVNLGCAKRVSSGLDWTFSLTDRAVILEDDCLVNSTFFDFAARLLDYHSEDQRVMSICAQNVQFGRERTNDSYYFSLYQHCWGWATWQRAWQHFDFEMSLWPEVRDKNLLFEILKSPRAVKYWTHIFQSTYSGKIDSWYYRWMFACWMQNGLSILPARNMVSKIGFGEDATHTTTSAENSQHAAMTTSSMELPLRHPPHIVQHAKADRFEQDTLFDPNYITRARSKLFRLLGKRNI